MDGRALTQFWTQVLDTAAEAVEAAARAHTLSPAECSLERTRIAADRSWLGGAHVEKLVAPLP
jgi:hypothetical protein